jgi:hypothetical protein
MFTFLKYKFNLNHIKKLGFLLIENTLRFLNKYQVFDAVYENNPCLLWESYETLNMT